MSHGNSNRVRPSTVLVRRKSILLFLLPLLLSLSGCLKDDLDPAALTSNPLDRDYNGPALVVLEHDTTRLVNDPGQPAQLLVEQKVRVRTELLQPLTTWTWRVKNLTTGAVATMEGSSATYTASVPNAVAGTQYCFEYTLLVQFTATKAYSYCTVAEL